MKNKFLVFIVFAILFGANLSAQKKIPELKQIEILNIGAISYPTEIEERGDIPFKMLVDEEYKKLLGDTIDYEKFRPTLMFFKDGFKVPQLNDKKEYFGYISVNILSGKYHFPKVLTEEQETAISNNLKEAVENNISGTQFAIKKWEPFKFETISGLPSVQYYYEQTQNGKSQTNNLTTNLYDSDLQIQIVLSAPKKEYKKWLNYYQQIVGTFVRKINISDKLTFEYSTRLKNGNDIPFKYMVDKEFKTILGDSINYEEFRPNLLLLDQSFSIEDSLDIKPFGNITLNILPRSETTKSRIDSVELENLKVNIKKSIEENLEPTEYKITNWYPFTLNNVLGLPLVEYSYDQSKNDGSMARVFSSTIFDNDMEIQVGMSSPSTELDKWQNEYQSILSSFRRIIHLPGVGTMVYPNVIVDERSDIPFVKLVDNESKKKLGDSINYEVYRPNLLFLEKNFNENDSLKLKSFNSITINTNQGDFSKISNPDSISNQEIEYTIKPIEAKNLENTAYSIVKWDSFDVSQLANGIRKISYSFEQSKDNENPKHICVTYFYTDHSQTRVTMTCNNKEFTTWEPVYIKLIESFRLEQKK